MTEIIDAHPYAKMPYARTSFPRKTPLTPSDESTIGEEYRKGENIFVLAKKYRISPRRLVRILGAQGIPLRYNWRRDGYQLTQTVFDVVREQSAYWIGLLMADGCIGDFPNRQKALSLQLQDRDAEHVEKFREFIGYNAPLARGSRPLNGKIFHHARLKVCSDRLCNKLMEYGVVPRKSAGTRVIGLEFNRHFWRGMLDGDGTIGWYPKGIGMSLIGSRHLMEQFSSFVLSVVSKGYACTLCHRPGVWRVAMSGRPCAQLLFHLYGGCCTYLDRKKKLADDLLARWLREGNSSGKAVLPN